MPPRLALQSVHRQCSSRISQWTASLSTTSRVAALRDVRSPSGSMLGLDTDSRLRRDSNAAIHNIWKKAERNRAKQEQNKQRTMEALAAKAESDNYSRQLPRKWRAGDVYAPHDLSPEEVVKWRTRATSKRDVCDILAMNPLDEYRNFAIISEYMTPAGRIKHSSETGLRPVNQRKMAKAIRRAIGLGIHPSVHRHPEILGLDLQYLGPQNTPSQAKRPITPF